MPVVTEWFSDIALHDPSDYYGGYKEPRVEQWGNGERTLSDQISGAWRGSQYTMRWSDHDRKIREILSKESTRYINQEPIEVYCTSRQNRAIKGRAWPVFTGPIIDAQTIEPMSVEITLGDHISQGMLSDRWQTPWRRVGDGGALQNLSSVAEDLDLDTPEPTIYGINSRVPDVDPLSPQGYCVAPTYLGIEPLVGGDYHVWLVAGHAVANIPTIRVNDVAIVEGSDWKIPHHPNWTAEFVTPYRDLTSRFGTQWRYTLIYGLVGSADPDACAAGTKTLTVAVEGVEPVGDGTGPVITDRIQQYKHWTINYVANRGPNSYTSGAWLTNPIVDLEDGPVALVDEDSFDNASATALLRLPPDGYIGAAVIGARVGERKKVTDYIAAWNRSCSLRFGINNQGQLFVVMMSPTAVIKAAATLYTDQYEILENSYSTKIGWVDGQANRIPYKGDYNWATGVATTTGTAEWAAAISLYGREILGEERDYPMAPGETALNHLAHIEVLALFNPPRRIAINSPIGPDSKADSLGYRELGSYICYKHFSSVSDTVGQIRLGFIEKIQILGDRTIRTEILDVDDLIDFDNPDILPGAGGGGSGGGGGLPPPTGDFGPTTDITCS